LKERIRKILTGTSVPLDLPANGRLGPRCLNGEIVLVMGLGMVESGCFPVSSSALVKAPR
jgi:hypothetical protein